MQIGGFRGVSPARLVLKTQDGGSFRATHPHPLSSAARPHSRAPRRVPENVRVEPLCVCVRARHIRKCVLAQARARAPPPGGGAGAFSGGRGGQCRLCVPRYACFAAAQNTGREQENGITANCGTLRRRPGPVLGWRRGAGATCTLGKKLGVNLRDGARVYSGHAPCRGVTVCSDCTQMTKQGARGARARAAAFCVISAVV